MSAYAHQMERQFSAQSLSSRGSERESRYIMESGFYMTSLAATIFISALVTFGVLLITLLITLAVMLQSCENRSAGVVESETQKLSYDYNTCKTLALHAELNNLDASQLPVICRTLAILYIEEGQYARDLNSSMWLVEDYFKSFTPSDDGRDVFLMDIDDIIFPSPRYANLSKQGYDQYGCNKCIGDAKHLKHETILQIYMELHASGWPLILLSRKPERQRNATIEHLVSAGFRDRSLLIMRSDDELHKDSREYFSRRRAALQKQGFRIAGTISSRYDALTGPYSAGLIFKLPNPIYYHGYDENQNEDTDTPV